MRQPVILVVDDEPAILRMIQMVLEEIDFRVLLARDGREALRILATETPSLILLDLNMPVMNGRQFLDEIALTVYNTIPVIIISAAFQTRPILGIAGILPKPFSTHDLTVALFRALNLTPTPK